MENLEAQTQVINLGKLLVKQLNLEDSNDTLSRWMAHYLSEKITLLEKSSSSAEREILEKDCFETILNLWAHRRAFPKGKRPFEKFETIFKVLERLNPDKEEHFFYRQSDIYLRKPQSENSNNGSIEDIAVTISEIDKAARIWIEILLQHAATTATDENTFELLENSISFTDKQDVTVIKQIITTKGENSADDSTKRYRQEKIKTRIESLEKFHVLNEAILKLYKQELQDLDK